MEALSYQNEDELTLSGALVALGKTASSNASIGLFYKQLTSSIRGFMPVERLAIRLIQPGTELIRDVYIYGDDFPGCLSGDTHDLESSITADAMESGKTLVIADARDPALIARRPALAASADLFPAVLSVPLRSSSRVIGVLQFRSKTPGHFDPERVRIAEAFAIQIAPVIENVHHVADLRTLAEERRALLELGETITSSLDIRSVFERFASLIGQVMPADRIVINTLNPNGNTYTVRHTSGVNIDSHMPGDVIELAGTMTMATIENRAPTVLHVCGNPDSEALLRRYPVIRPAVEAGICSLLAVPLINEGNVVGTFHAQSSTPFAYTTGHEQLMQQAAQFTATAIARSDLMRRVEQESLQTKVLAEIGRITGSALDFSEIFEPVVEQIKTVIPVDRAVIATIDDSGETITDRYICGLSIEKWDSVSSRPMRGLPTESVIKNRKAAFFSVDGPQKYGVVTTGLKASRASGLLSWMFTPLIAGDRVIGTLNFKACKENAYTEQHLAIAEAIALQIAGAVAASDFYLQTLRLAKERERRIEAESENRELLRVNLAKSEFLSTVSHELKTPLTTILAFCSILRKTPEGKLGTRDRNHLAVIKRNGERLDRLISDLVDVSRLDSGKITLESGWFKLHKQIQLLVESFGPIVGKRGQSIELDLSADVLSVYADPDRVIQIISNLVSNASKYSPDNSVIKIATSIGEGSVEVSVKDSGIGMSKKDRAELFNAFFRADNEEARAQPGTGLGLPIAKSLAVLHGGDITVVTAPGSGSTFTLKLPQPADRA